MSPIPFVADGYQSIPYEKLDFSNKMACLSANFQDVAI